MATTQPHKVFPNRWARASIANSLLLPIAGALQFNVTFWALVITNFALFHAVWVSQLLQDGWRAIDWTAAKWPLIAFAALGNVSFFVWEEQLLAAFG